MRLEISVSDDDFELDSKPLNPSRSKPQSSAKRRRTSTGVFTKLEVESSRNASSDSIQRKTFQVGSSSRLRTAEKTGGENLKQKKISDLAGTELNALLSLCGNAGSLDEEAESMPVKLSTSPVTVLQNITTSSTSLSSEAVGESSDRIHCPVCNEELSCMSVKQREDHSNACLDKVAEQTTMNPVEDLSTGFMEKLAEQPGEDLSAGFMEKPTETQRGDDSTACTEKLAEIQHEEKLADEPVEISEDLPGDQPVHEEHTTPEECFEKLAEQPLVAESVDVSPVVKFLEGLNLSKYAPLFVKEEIDWDTLQWLTEEDLCNLGIETYGPRKKIVSAVKEARKQTSSEAAKENIPPKRYITDFFGTPGNKAVPKPPAAKEKAGPKAGKKQTKPPNTKPVEVREWMKIPGTKFRVDAFKHGTTECSHWFLSHFHSDHYGGLTKGFRYGKIYCSMITARLVNLRIGVPWERLHPLEFNTRTNVDGVWVTLVDANHCPGAAMILFETPDGKLVLHTGDFRYCDEMSSFIHQLPTRIHTLILDTTYCNPQYDFPKQETVIQFVIDAIQAEFFNPKTLFLIGTYSLGKERLFMEVARVLQQKLYVGAVKRKMLACLDFSEEDMNWITTNDWESNIHVVPLWSIASFRRMSSISRHYHGKFNSIVSFSPTGWSFGRGKKRTNGKRFQQGTIIRYEVPYSEHSSFTELKQFVKLVSPLHIIPSVNNTSSHAAESMITSLM